LYYHDILTIPLYFGHGTMAISNRKYYGGTMVHGITWHFEI